MISDKMAKTEVARWWTWISDKMAKTKVAR
jgi:hypothetical protein